MASARYTLYLTPDDLKPYEAPPLTRKQKLKNWWDYHWKWVAIIAALLLLVILALSESLGQVQPDYHIGVVTRWLLPDEANEQLSQALAALGEDLNGDGQVVVQVDSYAADFRPQAEYEADKPQNTNEADSNPAAGAVDMLEGMEYMASQTRLIADIETCETMIYLTDDPAGLQDYTHVLSAADGTPAQGMEGVSLYPWTACPVLTGLELGEYTDIMGENPQPTASLFEGLTLVRRSFGEEGMPLFHTETEAFFGTLTQGAAAQ